MRQKERERVGAYMHERWNILRTVDLRDFERKIECEFKLQFLNVSYRELEWDFIEILFMQYM